MNLELESFIDRPIEQLIPYGDIDQPFKNKEFSLELNKFRTLILKANQEIGNMSFNKLQITIENKGLIKALTTAFDGIVNRLFMMK